MLPRHVSLAELREALPEWGYLRLPRRSIRCLEAIQVRLAQQLMGIEATAAKTTVSIRATTPAARAGAGFGIPEHNAPVEAAAIQTVQGWYQERGLTVVSVEHNRCGFDLDCTKGPAIEHAEVKGVSGTYHPPF